MSIDAFLFDKQHRLRSGLRFAIFVAGFFIFALFLLALVTVGFIAGGGALGSLAYLSVSNAVLLVSALVVGWLCNRYLEQLPYSALGASLVSGWLGRFAIGMVTGVITLGLSILIAVVLGGLAFTMNDVAWSSIAGTFLLSFVVFAISAASEEAVGRGYPMQTFFRSDLRVFGIVLTSALFASGHLSNPHVSTFAWINTFIAGVWFGVAYWRTGDLWLPFGMHLAWNWMMGAFFGVEVSGLTDIAPAPLLKELDRGPAWLTGESYGVEGGVACTIALVLSTVIIYLWPRRQKHMDRSQSSQQARSPMP